MILYDIIRRNSVLITHGSEMGSYNGFQGGAQGEQSWPTEYKGKEYKVDRQFTVNV